MALNQSNRLIRMTKGPLGPDEVVVTRLSGREAISRLFSFEIEFISTKLDLKPGEIVGAEIAIELDRRDPDAQPLPPRHFHGYVSRFAAGTVEFKDPGEHKYRHYRVEMVPWLWFLTQTARCFLYFPEKEDKSIFEVIEAVIGRAKSDLHVNPVSDLQGIDELNSRKVKHCVQYRETDFNFLSRTLEKYGVFYYFKFEAEKHTLVLDMKKNYPVCEEAEVVYASVGGPQPTADRITSWEHDYEFVPGKWSHTDYNFETSSTSLSTSAPKLPSVDVPQADKYEVYDYPGGFAVKSEGEADARIRQEEKEVQHNLVDGASTCRTFTAGHKFLLTAHPDADVVSEHDKSYVLTSVVHSASQPSDDTGDGNAASYGNRFTCLVDSVQFRPARTTPWPVISGVQTAVVVGPAGDEIYTDKYGQVKVQFHWDRKGQRDENSSCWIRVSQYWAGKAWGAMHIPRIGHEVIVDFLEGDPDQPIVVGRVYNDVNLPPYKLPDHKTQSGVKSRSSLEGSSENFNEIRFEDLKGKEEIVVHAERTLATTVEASESRSVGADRSTTIGHDDTLTVKNDHKVTVSEGNASLFVDGHNRVVIVNEEYYLLAKSIYEEAAEQSVAIKATAADVDVNAATQINNHIGESGNYVVIKSDGSITANATDKIDQHATNHVHVIGDGYVSVSSGVNGMQVYPGFVAVGTNEMANHVTWDGGGILVHGVGKVTIEAGGSTIEVEGSGIKVTSSGVVEVKGSTIKLN